MRWKESRIYIYCGHASALQVHICLFIMLRFRKLIAIDALSRYTEWMFFLCFTRKSKSHVCGTVDTVPTIWHFQVFVQYSERWYNLFYLYFAVYIHPRVARGIINRLGNVKCKIICNHLSIKFWLKTSNAMTIVIVYVYWALSRFQLDRIRLLYCSLSYT